MATSNTYWKTESGGDSNGLQTLPWAGQLSMAGLNATSRKEYAACSACTGRHAGSAEAGKRRAGAAQAPGAPAQLRWQPGLPWPQWRSSPRPSGALAAPGTRTAGTARPPARGPHDRSVRGALLLAEYGGPQSAECACREARNARNRRGGRTSRWQEACSCAFASDLAASSASVSPSKPSGLSSTPLSTPCRAPHPGCHPTFTHRRGVAAGVLPAILMSAHVTDTFGQSNTSG